MIDNVAACVIDDVVRLPIAGPVDVEVVTQEIVLLLLCSAKLADGEDVGLHIVDEGTNTFVLALRVVVGLIAVGITAVVIAIIQ
jgi:hypothetical protein